MNRMISVALALIAGLVGPVAAEMFTFAPDTDRVFKPGTRLADVFRGGSFAKVTDTQRAERAKSALRVVLTVVRLEACRYPHGGSQRLLPCLRLGRWQLLG